MNTASMFERQIPFQVRPIANRGSLPRNIVCISGVLLGADPILAAELGRKQVIHWLKEKVGTLPPAAEHGDSYEADSNPLISARGIRLTGKIDYWISKLDEINENGDVWSVEISIANSEESSASYFAIKLSVTSADKKYQPQITVPRVLEALATSPGVRFDTRKFNRGDVWNIEDEVEADLLAEFIQNPYRRQPIVAVSEVCDGSQRLVNPEKLAWHAAGLAHVCYLTPDASRYIAERFGKNFSVYSGAIRTYYPHFDLDQDTPHHHPLALRQKIETWNHQGANGFCEFLLQQLATFSVESLGHDKQTPSYAKVRAKYYDELRNKEEKSGASDLRLLEIAHQEIEALKKEAEDWEEFALNEEAARREKETEILSLLSKQEHLRQLIRKLEQNQHSYDENSKSIYPSTLEDLTSWAETNYPDRLIISPRAQRTAKKSDFQDINLVYKALSLLANAYCDAKRGNTSKMQLFLDEISKLHIAYEPTHSGSRAGEEGDAYYIIHNKSKRYLEHHLKRGVAHNTKVSLRIYFFWDEEYEQVVIGALPSHLPTRLS